MSEHRHNSMHIHSHSLTFEFLVSVFYLALQLQFTLSPCPPLSPAIRPWDTAHMASDKNQSIQSSWQVDVLFAHTCVKVSTPQISRLWSLELFGWPSSALLEIVCYPLQVNFKLVLI